MIETISRHCPSCGLNYDSDTKYCTSCGTELHQPVSRAQTVHLPDDVAASDTQVLQDSGARVATSSLAPLVLARVGAAWLLLLAGMWILSGLFFTRVFSDSSNPAELSTELMTGLWTLLGLGGGLSLSTDALLSASVGVQTLAFLFVPIALWSLIRIMTRTLPEPVDRHRLGVASAVASMGAVITLAIAVSSKQYLNSEFVSMNFSVWVPLAIAAGASYLAVAGMPGALASRPETLTTAGVGLVTYRALVGVSLVSVALSAAYVGLRGGTGALEKYTLLHTLGLAAFAVLLVPGLALLAATVIVGLVELPDSWSVPTWSVWIALALFVSLVGLLLARDGRVSANNRGWAYTGALGALVGLVGSQFGFAVTSLGMGLGELFEGDIPGGLVVDGSNAHLFAAGEGVLRLGLLGVALGLLVHPMVLERVRMFAPPREPRHGIECIELDSRVPAPLREAWSALTPFVQRSVLAAAAVGLATAAAFGTGAVMVKAFGNTSQSVDQVAAQVESALDEGDASALAGVVEADGQVFDSKGVDATVQVSEENPDGSYAAVATWEGLGHEFTIEPSFDRAWGLLPSWSASGLDLPQMDIDRGSFRSAKILVDDKEAETGALVLMPGEHDVVAKDPDGIFALSIVQYGYDDSGYEIEASGLTDTGTQSLLDWANEGNQLYWTVEDEIYSDEQIVTNGGEPVYYTTANTTIEVSSDGSVTIYGDPLEAGDELDIKYDMLETYVPGAEVSRTGGSWSMTSNLADWDY